MTTTQHDAQIEAVARALAWHNYPGGSKADIDEMWKGWTGEAAAAIAALSTASAPAQALDAGEVERLRAALIAAGRNAGALLADDVSTDFLMLIPEEVRGRIAKWQEQLSWYGEQARLARLIHSEGDAGRHALANDGGKRARAALATQERG